MEDNTMILKMKDGTEKRYEILLSYMSMQNGVKYIIFTDNKTNYNGELNLYAKRYNNKLKKLEDITDAEEWKDVEKSIDEYLMKEDGVYANIH